MKMGPQRRAGGQSGQAAVEAALTLPLLIFLILGTLQLFLAFHGRIAAEYAVYKAARAGALGYGDCKRMTHAAIGGVLPSFASFLGRIGGAGTPGMKLARAWRAAIRDPDRYWSQRYNARDHSGHTGTILWLIREQPLARDVQNLPWRHEDNEFDLPGGQRIPRLEVRMIYWFPLKIPFANWVISTMSLAHLGIRPYRGGNPLMVTQDRTNWTGGASFLDSEIAGEMLRRHRAQEYVMPIDVSWTMRMMTPARKEFFQQQNCRPAPNTL